MYEYLGYWFLFVSQESKQIILNKIENIIQFSSLQTKSIHIVNQLEKTDQAKMANKCDQQIFQKEIIHKFYDDINDYEAFIESSQLSLNPIAFKSFCYLLDL